MPSHRLRRVAQGQGGFSLVELLIAMFIASILLGLVVQSLGQASQDQQDIERRSQMQTDAQLGLERMTREIRQATWLQFHSSSVVDINVRVRSSAQSYGVYRLVRYDCSGDACLRSEGAPVNYPPPLSPTFDTTTEVVGAQTADAGSRRGVIVRHDIFRPVRIDPATGASVTDFARPDFLFVRMQLEIAQLHDPDNRRLTIEDGVSLRNRTGYAG